MGSNLFSAGPGLDRAQILLKHMSAPRFVQWDACQIANHIIIVSHSNAQFTTAHQRAHASKKPTLVTTRPLILHEQYGFS